MKINSKVFRAIQMANRVRHARKPGSGYKFQLELVQDRHMMPDRINATYQEWRSSLSTFEQELLDAAYKNYTDTVANTRSPALHGHRRLITGPLSQPAPRGTTHHLPTVAEALHIAMTAHNTDTYLRPGEFRHALLRLNASSVTLANKYRHIRASLTEHEQSWLDAAYGLATGRAPAANGCPRLHNHPDHPLPRAERLAEQCRTEGTSMEIWEFQRAALKSTSSKKATLCVNYLQIRKKLTSPECQRLDAAYETCTGIKYTGSAGRRSKIPDHWRWTTTDPYHGRWWTPHPRLVRALELAASVCIAVDCGSRVMFRQCVMESPRTRGGDRASSYSLWRKSLSDIERSWLDAAYGRYSGYQPGVPGFSKISGHFRWHGEL